MKIYTAWVSEDGTYETAWLADAMDEDSVAVTDGWHTKLSSLRKQWTHVHEVVLTLGPESEKHVAKRFEPDDVPAEVTE